jgi:hypothetical protein
MRPPLSRPRIPAPPRRFVGLFRPGASRVVPRPANHPAYFGLTGYVRRSTLSAVDGAQTTGRACESQCPFLVQKRRLSTKKSQQIHKIGISREFGASTSPVFQRWQFRRGGATPIFFKATGIVDADEKSQSSHSTSARMLSSFGTAIFARGPISPSAAATHVLTTSSGMSSSETIERMVSSVTSLQSLSSVNATRRSAASDLAVMVLAFRTFAIARRSC